MRLGAARAEADEALLGFGQAGSAAALSWNLSERGDLVEAASRLFPPGFAFLDREGR